MNRARVALSDGIAPNQTKAFREMVTTTLVAVESICREHRLSPEKLPAPTYRAYLYLKSIDLDHLPPPGKSNSANYAQTHASTPVRIKNLVAASKQIQTRLASLADGARTPDKRIRSTPLSQDNLLQQIQELVAGVEAVLAKADAQEGAKGALQPAILLPKPSLRAYLWLKFLSKPANLNQHLRGLKAAVQASLAYFSHHPMAKLTSLISPHSLPIQVEFANIPALFRSRKEKGIWRIIAHESFTGAPYKVIEALVYAAVDTRNKRRLKELRAYAAGKDFNKIAKALETPVGEQTHQAAGRVYNLREIFERVNAVYFNGAIDLPNLTWNRTITHRKLGHYQPATDTVMISITLDSPSVPTFVVEYVMYHELLHKKLGLKVSKGRRYAHTAEFRRQERLFERYEEAESYLKRLSAESDKL